MKLKLELFVCIIAILITSCSSTDKRQVASIERPPVEIIGKKYLYEKYVDSTGRVQYYYLPSANKSAPLVINIQGSGCSSLFMKDNGVVKSRSSIGNLAYLGYERFGLLAVEKPTVNTYDKFDRADAADDCTPQYRSEFNAKSWVATLKFALLDLIRNKNLQPEKIIVYGHSEGATFAAALAAEVPQITHIISSAGGGGSPLFENMSRHKRKNISDDEKNQLILREIEKWNLLAADPERSSLYWGHSPNYWISLLAYQPETTLLKSKASLYIVHGSNDDSAPVDTVDLLVSELTTKGRKLTYKRVAGADHIFNNSKTQDGYDKMLTEGIEWALNTPPYN